ncbi:MAG: L,D-transpeptidase family protein [Chloroflexota bacterium]|nr:L,D-transpeptidase family protein [Chloroflexota bacterium]
MDSYEPRRRSRARDRVQARQQRRQPMAVPRSMTDDASPSRTPRQPRPSVTLPKLPPLPNLRTRDFSPLRSSSQSSGGIPQVGGLLHQARFVFNELWWRATHTPQLLWLVGGIAAMTVVLFVLVNLFSGRIFPNIYALGVPLAGLTVDEATAQLERVWSRDMTITFADGARTWEAPPGALGLQFDARKTAEAARGSGLAGIPFGVTITPVVALVDELRAQNFLLDLSLQANVTPQNAGFRWQEGQLITVSAGEGRTLDVAETLGVLLDEPARVVDARRLELAMVPVLPDASEAAGYLEAVSTFTSQQFMLSGYDPFTDETISWSVDRDTLTSWLEAGVDGIRLRADAFRQFLQAQSNSLNADPDGLRFIEPGDAIDKMQEAINAGVPQVVVRIRYRATTYEVVSGDTGFRISRKTGIPFYLIQQANPNLDWETTILSPGDIINLPSRDLTMPVDPTPTKRIVVNLNTQSMIAYENGQPVFQWAISSGMSTAPTSPGIYQILSQQDIASGSSYTLCGERGCGSWQMYWFMGLYEVVPGLMNGFHGAVLLPNGTYLGGGNVGQPYTFGCVMSENSNAEQLYNWAEIGTVVEIVSNEFPPVSPLGMQTVQATGGI